jgi:hypothetical protein
MSERNKPHNGRDKSGHFKTRLEDVEDLRTDPNGEDFVRDDVRLGGAIGDTGPDAGKRGERIGDLVQDNRQDIARVTDWNASGRKR